MPLRPEALLGISSNPVLAGLLNPGGQQGGLAGQLIAADPDEDPLRTPPPGPQSAPPPQQQSGPGLLGKIGNAVTGGPDPNLSDSQNKAASQLAFAQAGLKFLTGKHPITAIFEGLIEGRKAGIDHRSAFSKDNRESVEHTARTKLNLAQTRAYDASAAGQRQRVEQAGAETEVYNNLITTLDNPTFETASDYISMAHQLAAGGAPGLAQMHLELANSSHRIKGAQLVANLGGELGIISGDRENC